MAQERLFALRSALIAALLAFFVFGAMGWSYVQNLKAVKQHAARSLAQSFALRVVERFHETIGPVFMLATMVRQTSGTLSDFDQVAADLIHEFPLIRAMELAPGGVVTQVYPLRGNEVILGHDLLKDKERNRDAHTALMKRQLTLAGPVELKQGGLGAIARYPIFFRDDKGKSSFWGFSITLINVPELLAVAGEMDLVRAGYNYRLCRMPQGEEGCIVFATGGQVMGDEPISVKIGLPNNNWILSLAPESGWVSVVETLMVLGLALIGSLIVGAGQFLLLSAAPRRSGSAAMN